MIIIMKIKISSKSLITLLGFSVLSTSCNDSFMDRYPETSITEKNFFKTTDDLESYTNNMYGYLSGDYWDVVSDNVVYKESSDTYELLGGNVTTETIGMWSWDDIRNVNFMISRAHNVEGDIKEINHFIGLARMFRAKLYYDKVKKYSDVPWYSRDLQTTDTDLLYKTQDPRSLVVDSVMQDLEFAVNNMQEGTSKTKIHRDVALALQARIALNEGTFRKYHKELGLNDYERFLNIAISSAEQLMDGSYSLSTEKNGDLEAYESLFCSTDLTKNPEMILVRDYDKSLGVFNNAQQVPAYSGLSRDLMEDYLVIDGDKTIRFQDIPDYEVKTFGEIFENRDPRMMQTFMWPGYQRADEAKPTIPELDAGGYLQIKFDPRTYDQIEWNKSYIDLPIFRYAEILLIYAEAKAELGILTQDDLDRSINLLRDRVGMPHALLSEWINNIDPVQNTRYANVESSQKGAVLEVRRERRIELACEGFRYDDLMRWCCGKLMNKAPEGMYIPGSGKYDLTGDGVNDVYIALTKAESEAIKDEAQAEKLTVYTLEGHTIELSNYDKGYIRIKSQVGKFNFIEPKYYYTPLDVQDISMNPNLIQNKYWQD